ncbi:Cyclic nucleotide-binding domain-containing protein [Methylomagnum ishizawai]|uniref:Cyclic nucleotide-binding domain-containing protein n=1 Tax=Methylomagnum ishizawai TaxID=1760988 RepID=A0A1Y6CXV7_9GAMM|nr:cyclic nucleotide-binding domain-containing protein [Methylomagnum ishizawai]SMF95080.1 Cyclic nucleotide-binding domain-containing protein [Methylomagnum ishizawai]
MAISPEAQELRRLIPLNTLSAPRFEQLCAELKIEDGPKGTLLFRQGDPTHEFVYVLSGTISLQAGGVEMDAVTGGSETGRFALAHQNPRKVSAVAKDRVRYVRVATDQVNQRDEGPAPLPGYTVSHSPDTSGGDWISALLRSPIFRRLPPSNLQALLRAVEEIPYKKGEFVCKQDDPGDYFYIIKQGQCALTRKPSQLAKDIKLATLKDYDTFGEDALISEKPRTVTVTMATNGVLLRLDKANFMKLVGQPVIGYVDSAEARAMMKQDGQWLDLRLPDIYQQGHPRGAINTPFFSLRMMLPSLERHRKYVLVCEDGKVSAAGSYLLLRHGFEAYALRGGIDTLPPELIVQAGPTDNPGPGDPPQDPDPAAAPPGTDDIDLDIELAAWEPPAPGWTPPDPVAPTDGEPTDDTRKLRDRLARAERELQFLETERGQLAREKDAALAELDQTKQTLQRHESRLESLVQDHGRLARELAEAQAARAAAGGAGLEELRKALEELKAAHSQALFEKEAAEQEVEALHKQVGELKTVVEEFLDSGDYSGGGEAEALRSELEMVRQHALAEVAALQARTSEIEAENTKLKAETQTLKTQISVREVAATVAMRETSANLPKASLAKQALWALLAGLLLAALVLGGLLGLEPGRALLRSLIEG